MYNFIHISTHLQLDPLKFAFFSGKNESMNPFEIHIYEYKIVSKDDFGYETYLDAQKYCKF